MKKFTESEKSLILKLNKQGLNSNEIKKKIPGYTRQQIAAVIAWNTMSGYQSKTVSISEAHKRTMLNFIRKQGLKTKDLMLKFKQYSRQQIAAVIAWETMGSYR